MEYLKNKLEAKKAIIRLKVGTLRAKWLQELKFKKIYLKGYYKAAL